MLIFHIDRLVEYFIIITVLHFAFISNANFRGTKTKKKKTNLIKLIKLRIQS